MNIHSVKNAQHYLRRTNFLGKLKEKILVFRSKLERTLRIYVYTDEATVEQIASSGKMGR